MAMDSQARGAIFLWLVVIPLIVLSPAFAVGAIWLARLGLYALLWSLGMVHAD